MKESTMKTNTGNRPIFKRAQTAENPFFYWFRIIAIVGPTLLLFGVALGLPQFMSADKPGAAATTPNDAERRAGALLAVEDLTYVKARNGLCFGVSGIYGKYMVHVPCSAVGL